MNQKQRWDKKNKIKTDSKKCSGGKRNTSKHTKRFR